MFHFQLWPMELFIEQCQNYSAVCIGDFDRNQEVDL